MGCVYNRGSRKKPNWWIKWKDPGGGTCYRKIGPDRELAKRVLCKIEGDITAGRYGLDDESRPKRQEPTFAQVGQSWVRKRLVTHRDGRHDVSRMTIHLIPFFGHCRLGEINPGLVKQYIESKQGELSGATLRLTLSLLSRLFNDLIEEGADLRNPVAALDRSTRRRVRSDHDPRTTPFLHSKEDIRRLYLAFPPATELYTSPYRPMFAVGVFAGLRTGEILALDWERDVSLEARRIHVQWQVQDGELTTLKDRESRVVPILDTLLPVLYEWKKVGSGHGLCFPPHPRRGGCQGSPPCFRRPHRLHLHLQRALAVANLPTDLTWYQCTRHTFASHWVLDGRPIERLKEILGHSSVTVTERYAHLRPDMFNDLDYAALRVDLAEGRVLSFQVENQSSELRYGYDGDSVRKKLNKPR